jgi:hypothetical protein
MTDIALQIDSLVIEGADPSHKERIVGALEKELTRLFSEKGAAREMAVKGDVAKIDAGALKGNPAGRPGVIGTRAAQNIYRAIRSE